MKDISGVSITSLVVFVSVLVLVIVLAKHFSKRPNTYIVYDGIDGGCINICSGETKKLWCKNESGFTKCKYSCSGKLTNTCD